MQTAQDFAYIHRLLELREEAEDLDCDDETLGLFHRCVRVCACVRVRKVVLLRSERFFFNIFVFIPFFSLSPSRARVSRRIILCILQCGDATIYERLTASEESFAATVACFDGRCSTTDCVARRYALQLFACCAQHRRRSRSSAIFNARVFPCTCCSLP